MVGFYIDLIANRREIAVGTGTPADTYKFEVIVAGYDADGTPKIEKLTITAEIQKTKDGHSYWSTAKNLLTHLKCTVNSFIFWAA